MSVPPSRGESSARPSRHSHALASDDPEVRPAVVELGHPSSGLPAGRIQGGLAGGRARRVRARLGSTCQSSGSTACRARGPSPRSRRCPCRMALPASRCPGRRVRPGRPARRVASRRARPRGRGRPGRTAPGRPRPSGRTRSSSGPCPPPMKPPMATAGSPVCDDDRRDRHAGEPGDEDRLAVAVGDEEVDRACRTSAGSCSIGDRPPRIIMNGRSWARRGVRRASSGRPRASSRSPVPGPGRATRSPARSPGRPAHDPRRRPATGPPDRRSTPRRAGRATPAPAPAHTAGRSQSLPFRVMADDGRLPGRRQEDRPRQQDRPPAPALGLIPQGDRPDPGECRDRRAQHRRVVLVEDPPGEAEDDPVGAEPARPDQQGHVLPADLPSPGPPGPRRRSRRGWPSGTAR